MTERRQRTLTDEDIQAISIAFQTHHPACNMGLTPEEVGILKKFLKAWGKATTLIGTVVLTALVLGFIGIFTKGFWITLIEGAAKK